jgi:hypothetical protein
MSRIYVGIKEHGKREVIRAESTPTQDTHGDVIVARGPDRRVLWAELTALGNVAGQIIREQT